MELPPDSVLSSSVNNEKIETASVTSESRYDVTCLPTWQSNSQTLGDNKCTSIVKQSCNDITDTSSNVAEFPKNMSVTVDSLIFEQNAQSVLSSSPGFGNTENVLSVGFSDKINRDDSLKYCKEDEGATKEEQTVLNEKQEYKDSETSLIEYVGTSCGTVVSADESKIKAQSDVNKGNDSIVEPYPDLKRKADTEEDTSCKKVYESQEPLDTDTSSFKTEVVNVDSEEQGLNTCATISYNFDLPVKKVAEAWEEFSIGDTKDCYTRGCKWAPDGSCIVTNSNDNVLRIFNFPQEFSAKNVSAEDEAIKLTSVLKMAEGGLIYDFCWYPKMSSWDPVSCCLISSSQDSPLHLFDAFTGELRCSYMSFNLVDELIAAHSVAFNLSGDKIYCGFKNSIRIFDTCMPGKKCEVRNLKSKNPFAGTQRGIISCITFNPAITSIYAASSYLKSVGLYSEPEGTNLCLLQGQSGGITHLKFSPDGTKLYSGGRKDKEIICWDVRQPGQVLYVMERTVETNQRIYFDVTSDGRYLLSGSSSGTVTVWDTLGSLEVKQVEYVLPVLSVFKVHDDCTNGLSLHPQFPIIATSSGQRHFPEPSTDSDDSDGSPLFTRKYMKHENSFKLWWAGR